MGLSSTDVVQLASAFKSNMAAMYIAITNAGRFSFQQFYTTPKIPYPMCGAPLVAKNSCVNDFRRLCAADSPTQTRAVFAAFSPGGCARFSSPPDFMQDLASFLLWRGPYAWLGISLVV